MPERKSGPVKPPVIEASPRSETKAGAPGTDKPATPPVAGKARRPLPPLALAVGYVLAGALLGTALTGGLLAAGLLPVASDAAALARLDAHIERQEARLAELDGRVTAVDNELASKAEGSALDALKEQLAAVPASGGDDGQLASELAALKERVDGLAAGGAEADLSGLTQRLDALAAALEQQKRESEAAIAELNSRLEQAGAADDAARLPLLVVQLGDAFAAGTPYATVLNAIRALQPDLAVPAAVAGKAETGLVPAAQLQQDFATALPAMLAAAPAAPDAGWQGTALDWLKGQLALRPAEDPGGDAPQAQVARLEAAMARRDYEQAAELFKALPAPMQAAAGEVAQAVATHAEAQKLVADLTRQTLAPAAGAAP
jgi:hypothetical protein